MAVATDNHRRRIGVLGGTFDPIHIGHLIMAEEARVRHALERVLFVPARVPPHKIKHAFSPDADRLQMVRLATEDHPGFAFSTVDLDREGPSFTLDTLRLLGAQYGEQAELFFIMGMDSLAGLETWCRPREIMRLARFIVITRPDYGVDLADLEKRLPGITSVTDLLDTVHIGISSTDLRQRVRHGLPIRYQVPACVEDYIRARGLYRDD